MAILLWLDKNEDGTRDSGEELLSGITVYAIDISTNRIATDKAGIQVKATTNNEGAYILANMPEGNYLVAFEYDIDKYMVTAYHAEGVSSDKNSDAIKTTKKIDGSEKTLAVTDNIKLVGNMSNIDLGLLEAKVFDLELEKR